MVQAQLNGFLPSDFRGPIPPIDVRDPPQRPKAEFPPVEIRDARARQAHAASDAEFFHEYGFAIFKHRTKVVDWDKDASVYRSEIDDIIRHRLMPGRRVEIIQPPSPLRRGRGTKVPQYASAVHADDPLTPELYAQNIAAFAGPEAGRWWLKRYQADDVAGFMSIDFWRPTNMNEPLRHMPLALCAPSSVDRADIFPTAMVGIAPEGRTSHHLALRFNPSQQWYFYPAMRTDEVLAFKLSESWKDAPDAEPVTCFHSAFRDPTAPDDAEERQSCEHRVGILVLND